MKLVLNQTDPDNVRHDEFQGREFIVAPVTPIKSMELDKGYVPEAHVTQSAPAWNGTPATLNHPRDENGQLVSANSPDVAEKTWLGHLFNTTPIDDGRLRGELWVDIEHANAVDAGDIVEKMENGDPISVSTSYFGDQLPAGEYDGEHRDRVVGNLRPDHLAVLPDTDGICSIDDGCVAGPQAANSGETVLRVAAEADDSSSDAEQGEDSGGPGLATKVANGVKQAFSEASLTVEHPVNESAESDNGSPTMDRDKQIDVLVEEHGFNEESLDGMGDDCLQRTYESFNEEDDSTEAEGEEPEAESGDEEPDDEQNEELTAESIAAELEDQFVTTDDLGDAVSEAMATNREQEQKEDLAEQIVANTEYESADDVLDDYPTEAALETKLDDVRDAPVANFAGQPGATATATNDEAANFPSLTANARAKERED